MNDFSALEARLDGLLTAASPAERRDLARTIAARLRGRQGKRIAAQQNPDGTPYAPRKSRLRGKKGFVRRQMFSRLRTAKWLKTEATPDAAVVAFAASVQRIARVHHEGLRDRVNRRGGPEVDYPARRLLGFDTASIDEVEDLVLAHLAGR